MSEISLNAPCPCGSGRKFKKCCGAEEHAERRAEARRQSRELLRGGRVLMERPPDAEPSGLRKPVTWPVVPGDDAEWDRFSREQRLGLAGPRTYPVAKLTDEGVDWGVVPQPGDEIAYGMDPWRQDDCLVVALATLTQEPIESLPDFKLRERMDAGEDPDHVSRNVWDTVASWAADRGLALGLWLDGELPVSRKRWVGLTKRLGSPGFGDHCLIMSGERVIFDPATSVREPPGFALLRWESEDVIYAITKEQEEE